MLPIKTKSGWKERTIEVEAENDEEEGEGEEEEGEEEEGNEGESDEESSGEGDDQEVVPGEEVSVVELYARYILDFLNRISAENYSYTNNIFQE